jgi:hypothetical protein
MRDRKRSRSLDWPIREHANCSRKQASEGGSVAGTFALAAIYFTRGIVQGIFDEHRYLEKQS